MKPRSVLIGVLASLPLTSCVGPPRPYEIEREARSPAGILASLTRQAYGGAAGGLACKLFLTNGNTADLHAEPVAVFSHACAVELQWAKLDLLIVGYDGNATEIWKFKSWRWFGDSAERQFRVEVVMQRQPAATGSRVDIRAELECRVAVRPLGVQDVSCSSVLRRSLRHDEEVRIERLRRYKTRLEGPLVREIQLLERLRAERM